MESFSALLALCEGNPPVTDGFPPWRPATRIIHVRFALHLNKRLRRQSRRRWFEMSSRWLWRHCNDKRISLPTVNTSVKYVSVKHRVVTFDGVTTHDDIMPKTHAPHNRPFVWGIHCLSVACKAQLSRHFVLMLSSSWISVWSIKWPAKWDAVLLVYRQLILRLWNVKVQNTNPIEHLYWVASMIN